MSSFFAMLVFAHLSSEMPFSFFPISSCHSHQYQLFHEAFHDPVFSLTHSQPEVIAVFSESFLILFLFKCSEGRSCDFCIPVDLGNHSVLSELSELMYPLNSKTLLSQILLSWNN